MQGRDAILDTELLRYKRHISPYNDSDTDDAISLEASTLGVSASDRMKTSEVEAELTRIREVSIIFVYKCLFKYFRA